MHYYSSHGMPMETSYRSESIYRNIDFSWPFEYALWLTHVMYSLYILGLSIKNEILVQLCRV